MMSLNTVVPTDVDVLSGPQAITHKLDNHAGNQQFRSLIQSNKTSYHNMTNRTAKTLMIEKIACSVLEAGGRFLSFDGVEWSVMSRRRITDKIGHALRCGKPRRNSRTKATKAATAAKKRALPAPVSCHVIPDEPKTEAVQSKTPVVVNKSLEPLRIFSENESNNSPATPPQTSQDKIEFDLSILRGCDNTPSTGGGFARRVSSTSSSVASMPTPIDQLSSFAQADEHEPCQKKVEIDLSLLRESAQSQSTPRRVSNTSSTEGDFEEDMLASIEELMTDGQESLVDDLEDLEGLLRLPILEMR